MNDCGERARCKSLQPGCFSCLSWICCWKVQWALSALWFELAPMTEVTCADATACSSAYASSRLCSAVQAVRRRSTSAGAQGGATQERTVSARRCWQGASASSAAPAVITPGWALLLLLLLLPSSVLQVLPPASPAPGPSAPPALRSTGSAPQLSRCRHRRLPACCATAAHASSDSLLQPLSTRQRSAALVGCSSAARPASVSCAAPQLIWSSWSRKAGALLLLLLLLPSAGAPGTAAPASAGAASRSVKGPVQPSS